MALFNTGYKEYSKYVDYSSISNITELRKARRDLEHKIEKKETELTFRYKAVKEFLSPSTYISRFILKFESLEHIIRCFCKGFNTVREIIRGEYGSDTK